MIEQISTLPDNVVGFVAKGEVTSDDYKQRLEPAIDHALAAHDKIRLLYVLGGDFTGFAGGAMWEDGKVGLEHLTRWERIAVVSNQPWIRHAVNVLGYLIPGQVKAFELADKDDATTWITG